MCPAGLFSFYRHPTEPVSFGCQVPSSKFVCISPSVPYHCHQDMGMTSRPREPSSSTPKYTYTLTPSFTHTHSHTFSLLTHTQSRLTHTHSHMPAHMLIHFDQALSSALIEPGLCFSHLHLMLYVIIMCMYVSVFL